MVVVVKEPEAVAALALALVEVMEAEVAKVEAAVVVEAMGMELEEEGETTAHMLVKDMKAEEMKELLAEDKGWALVVELEEEEEVKVAREEATPVRMLVKGMKAEVVPVQLLDNKGWAEVEVVVVKELQGEDKGLGEEVVKELLAEDKVLAEVVAGGDGGLGGKGCPGRGRWRGRAISHKCRTGNGTWGRT